MNIFSKFIKDPFVRAIYTIMVWIGAFKLSMLLLTAPNDIFNYLGIVLFILSLFLFCFEMFKVAREISNKYF